MRRIMILVVVALVMAAMMVAMAMPAFTVPPGPERGQCAQAVGQGEDPIFGNKGAEIRLVCFK
jgi:hypothetical protein